MKSLKPDELKRLVVFFITTGVSTLLVNKGLEVLQQPKTLGDVFGGLLSTAIGIAGTMLGGALLIAELYEWTKRWSV